VAALCLAEEKGLGFTGVDVAGSWLRLLPYNCLYSCTKQAYYNLVLHQAERPLAELVEELPLMNNPMREGLNASIRVDLYGFIAPTDPRLAARLAHTNAAVNSVKNGIYAAMFTVGCISAAMSREATVETILAGGLSAVPRESRLAEAIGLTREWYSAAGEWEPVCEKIYRRWGHLNWAGAMYNFPIVTLALLHGALDFSRSICTAVMCGVDTDCTAGTVGSIVGAAVGKEGVGRDWYAPFNDRIETFVAGNGGGDGTISGLVARTIAVHDRRD
jgi:hypothetical protein